MQRYGIYPIIGNGQEGNEFRPSIHGVTNTNYGAVLPTDGQGQPLWGFALCRVAGVSEAALSNPTNSFLFPDVALDAALSSMDSGVRNGMVQSAEAYDLDGQGTHFDCPNDDEDTLRTVITALGQQLTSAFSLANLGCSEVAQ